MLPALADGTPLCLLERFRKIPLAWAKLWKHHGAKAETDRINEIARERKEPWLARYGGTIGIEWFWPKVLETLNGAPEVYEAAEVWIEAGDWIVWQLVSGPFPRCSVDQLARSTCQAGYKAMWNRQSGYPSRDYFAAVDRRLTPESARDCSLLRRRSCSAFARGFRFRRRSLMRMRECRGPASRRHRRW